MLASRLLAIAACLLSLGAAATDATRTPVVEHHSSAKLEQLWPAATLDVLRRPSQVASFRLAGMSYTPRVCEQYALNDCGYVKSAGPALEPDELAMVDNWLAARRDFADMTWRQYSDKTDTGCHFAPGVGLEFVRGKQRVALLLCYACNVIALQPLRGDLAGANHMWFSPMAADRAAMVRLAKRLFPDDAAIGKLSE
jgi:hypothetical protein